MSLTTPDRVRGRLGYSDPTLTDPVLQIYIDDATAYIQRVTRTTFFETTALFELARSVCTDMAAIYAIIRPAGGVAEGLDYTIDEFTVKKSKKLESALKTAAQFRINAREGLAALEADETDVPISNTQEFDS